MFAYLGDKEKPTGLPFSSRASFFANSWAVMDLGAGL